MGMSASQARYLSLTARKSDLEYRGQQINQSRLMLSNQSANLYSSMLSMSVPTPPVETDYMKDVYTFSMNGDTVTLTSSKLSMGRDGYNYDIIYSRPESKNILASSATSDVQRSITRSASNTGKTVGGSSFKVATTYDDSAPVQKSPNVSRLVNINDSAYKDAANTDNLMYNNTNYNNFWSYLARDGSSHESKPSNPSYESSSNCDKLEEKDEINFNESVNSDTPTILTYNDNQYNKVSKDDLTNIFGCSLDNNKFNDLGALKNIINTNAKLDSSANETLSAYQFYINAENMKLMVISAGASANSDERNIFADEAKSILSDNAVVKEYDLATILGLKYDSSITNSQEGSDTKVYYYDTKSGSTSERNYYTFSMDEASENSCNFKFQDITNEVKGIDNDSVTYTLEGNELVEVSNVEKKFGIVANEDQNGDSSKDDLKYQYFRDTTTGDIWELCTRTAISGTISEEWKLFEAQKEVTYDNQEAQLIDESEWPSGISHVCQQKGDYECYYVPDETGTGGSYYMVPVGTFVYGPSNQEISGDGNSIRQYDANNTYNIDGNVACVVSSDKVPSTILDAYDDDSYIVYATYDDSDTDFSDPIKYYVFPKDDESADAVCSYAYEKSYTGKNELVQARANILVDENGRFSKIDIKGEGTFALEYGQEKDEEAYNEAYRDYEYRLQKYEKEMQDIDAQTALIQEQDKKLELQLKSIDTEHSAIQTELEALKKVIDQNIQSSFGTFGG